jgi:hypothetical protein
MNKLELIAADIKIVKSQLSNSSNAQLVLGLLARLVDELRGKEASAPATSASPITEQLENEPSFLRNEIGTLMQIQTLVAQTLKQPAGQTRADLPAHAQTIMAELERLRGFEH